MPLPRRSSAIWHSTSPARGRFRSRSHARLSPASRPSKPTSTCAPMPTASRSHDSPLPTSAARLPPLTLRAALGLDPAAGGSGAATTKIKVDARAGALRVALQGEAGAARDAFRLENLAALAAAKVNLSARVDADEGSTLIELLGLDRFLVVDKRPARLTLAVKGVLDGDLAVDGQLAAGALNIASNGTVRLPDRAGASGELNLKLTNANLRSPRPASAARAAEPLPASISARLALSQGMLRFTELTGTVAGASVR